MSTEGLEAPTTEPDAIALTTTTKAPEWGYDLQVFGLETGKFAEMHIIAMTCIGLSLLCAIAVSFSSFKVNSGKKFFKWSQGEKTVIYLAVCDGLFNIAHTMDHAHYLSQNDHVRPSWLCELYGFTLLWFITAQNLMVNAVAINAFMLIYWNKQINFGKKDWRLLVYTFGVPAVIGVVAWILGQLGPNGAFCYFDGVNGYLTNILLTTVPLILVTVINIVIYGLTWNKIRVDVAQIKKTLGEGAPTANAAHSAAKSMMLFVAAFVIQWWAMTLYGLWQLISDPPLILFRLVTTFSNLGGVLNGIVFIILRRRMKREKKHKVVTDSAPSKGDTSMTTAH